MDLKGQVTEFINVSKVMTLATCSKTNPWVCNVFYVADKHLNLYFLSGNAARHSKEISKNPKSAVAIYDHESNFEGVKGVQMSGVVKELKFVEAMKVLIKFKRVFNAKLNEVDFKQVVGSRFYKFVPKKVYFRNANKFKGREEVNI